ncbi:MAG TPA: protein kinase [Bacteroidota bacterium]|nr:protein kinase [Bacteroidota bacterium]
MINDRYDVIRTLGSGSSGDVYLVFDRERSAQVAMKVIKSGRGVDIDGNRHEFNLLSSFNHPNLVRVYECGQIVRSDGLMEFDHRHFFTMEYLQGASNALEYFGARALDEQKMNLLEEVLIQILFALDSVHRNGIIHFDIKPENIFILPNREEDETHGFSLSIKLADFGFSSKAAASEGLSNTASDVLSSIRGTIGYIAPELLQGNRADVRVDLYSLGASVYRLLSNQLPYQAETPLDALKNALQAEPPPLQPFFVGSSILPGIVQRLLSRDPNTRGNSAWDVLSQFGSTRHEVRIKHHLINLSVCGVANSRNGISDELEHAVFVSGELPEETLEKMFEVAFGEKTVSHSFLRQLCDNYGGNPDATNVAVRSMVNAIPLRMLRDPGYFEREAASMESLVDHELQGYIGHIVSSLNPEERELLEVLSCFRTPAMDELLIQITPFEQVKLIELLESLRKRGCIVICEGNRFAIRQEALKCHLYNSGMSRERRAQLHESISRSWEELSDEWSSEELCDLARHHELSGHQEMAGARYEQVADEASRAGSFSEASAMYTKACAALHGNAPSALRLKEAQSYRLAGEDAKAAKLWNALLARGDATIKERVLAAKELGKAYARLGENSRAVETLEGLLVGGLNGDDLFEVRQELIALKTDEGFFDDALTLGAEQRKLASGFADRQQLALVENDMGIAHFYKGHLHESFEAFSRAYRIYSEANNTDKVITALNNRGNVLSAMGETRGALESWNHALEAALSDASKLHQQGMLLNNIGIAHFKLGEFRDARMRYDSAKEIFTELQQKSGIAYSQTNIGELEFAEGNLERAVRAWQQALLVYDEMQGSLGIGQTLLELTLVFMVIGDLDSARNSLDKASGVAREFGLSSLDPFRIYLEAMYAASTGEMDAALDLFTSSEKGFLSVKDAFTGGIEKPEQRIAQIRLKRAEIYLADHRCALLLGLLTDTADHHFSLSPDLRAEREYVLGKIARMCPELALEHPLVHFKRGMTYIENANVSELTWKISLELGAEFQQRGNAEKALEYYHATKAILEYFASAFVDESLRERYLSSECRARAMSTVLRALSAPHEGVVPL